MKRLTYFLLCLLVSIGVATAQTTRVSGTVISADDGESVIGAAVMVPGTSVGTVTNYDGTFSLEVPQGTRNLEFSYIGMKTQQVAIASVMNVVMQSDTQLLGEVVVTALGIKRSEKALGFAATTVDSDRLTESRSNDIMSSIAGKVAGVQISTGTDPGSSNSVIIRGVSSLSGSNQPLYVIDGVPMNNSSTTGTDGLNRGYDFGNGANAVNPNDVESMTILKGAAATALYGNRAANGVIIITTKSGQANQKGIGIEYNFGFQGESILRLPEMQNEFGIGWSGDYTMIENGSWGPRFDGSMQLWGNVYNNSQKLKPYLPLEDNVKDFFETGTRMSNSVSFSNATENNNYFVSFSQLTNDGITPSDADTYDRYTFSARGEQTVGALRFSSALNFTSQNTSFVTTGQGLSMLNSLYQTPRDISIIGQKDLEDPFNNPGYYYTPYGVTNPYYIIENYKNSQKSEKVFGKFEVEYSFLNYFKLMYRIGLDAMNYEQLYGEPNLEALYPGTPNYTSNLVGKSGEVSVTMRREREINQDLMLIFDMPVTEDIHVNAIAGVNGYERKVSSNQSTVTGLDIPTWYHLSNSANTPTLVQRASRKRLMGVYGQAEIGWRNMAYLTVTARNDWSSTLPEDNRSFFYPGVTGSFIFSEVLPEELSPIITFGKVRMAYGKTGNDADPYSLFPYYSAGTFGGSGFGNTRFPLNNTNAFTLGNVLGNLNLSPEITTEWEIGLNMSFLKGRISFDAAYYDRTSDKQIFELDMDPATGYTAQNINLGEVSNKGVELLVNVRPIEIKDFSWDIGWTFTKNNSKVVSLPEQFGGETSIYGLTGGTSMYAIVGEPVGTFKAEVAERDPEGRIVVNSSTGLPVAKPDFDIVGSMNYDYEMGISTTFNYKGISLSADLDIRQGGLMYSRTKAINYFVGNPIQTAYNDRNTFIVPNSVNKIVDGDNVTYVENTTPIPSGNIYDYWGTGATEMGSYELIDKSYVKLRSVVLGYDLPANWLRNTPFAAVRLSVYGNNLFVWTPSSNTFIDPEMTSFGNDLEGKYGEWTSNPSTRKFGFNLMVKF